VTEPAFFATSDAFRAWLAVHHETERELLVGFWKVGSGKPSISWPESVDEALSFGWIDGIRRSLDGESYTIRFTPRKPNSIWSAVNIRRANELIERGHMQAAGLAAFERRHADRSGIYSFERSAPAELEPGDERLFRANAPAWDFFSARPPSYRRAALHWVVSAKQQKTREKRLATLINDSEQGRTIAPLTRPAKPSPGGGAP
jgi:uncharacterized protein YdeI (YjbR/CyaY-like superfamily)